MIKKTVEHFDIAQICDSGQCFRMKQVAPSIVLFLKTGVCGGFTTFSTFSLEAYTLFQKEQYGLASGYVVLSVALCLAGIWCGMYLARLSCAGGR